MRISKFPSAELDIPLEKAFCFNSSIDCLTEFIKHFWQICLINAVLLNRL